MGRPNFENRTLYCGDNLPALRLMNSDTVHLIATDPPFKKQRGFFSDAGGYDDRWTWQKDILGLDGKGNAVAENHDDWIDQIQDDWPGAWQVIDTARAVYGDDMGAFLCWLGVRLMEMHRVLRDDGSIYLHIDHTAHAWVKALMDAVFGKRNFRNEIVWFYKTGGVSKRWFGKKHDTILFYSKSNGYRFTSQKEKSYLSHKYGFSNITINEDDQGFYTLVTMRDVWDIPALRGNQPETTGYPTQKPIALYERIIRASSSPGDIVLDPFCGCATTPIAAERLSRQWVGMDIWDGAYDRVVERLRAEPDARMQILASQMVFINNRELGQQFPPRTDGNETAAPALRLRTRRPTEPWQQLSNALMRRILTAAQQRNDLVGCAGCGRLLEGDFFHLDHISPKSEGGENYITNRILICAPCNSRKSNTSTLTGLQRGNRREGWMKDRQLAEEMQSLARMRAEWIRDAWGTEQCNEFIAGLA